jgi:Flp pilus assembly protein TadG
MISFFGKLMRSRRGNVLAIAAATMPLFIAAAGLATDTIQWTLWKRQLQRAADSAAISGVYNRESNDGRTTGAINGTATDTAVAHDLTVNLHTFYSLKTGFPTISYPADSGVMTDQVTVTVAIQQPLSFSSLFLTTAPTITATSTAASIPAGGDACIEALDPNAKNAVYFSGNAAVYMPDCDVFSNSANSNAAAAKGSAAVTANTVGGVGGVASSSNFTVTAYRPYSPALADPFSGVTPSSSDMNCTTAALDDKSKASDFSTGTNCFGSLSVGSNKSLNLDTVLGSGTKTIYLNGGSADIKGDLTCTSCTIVLTNKSASTPIGTFSANASANINITAPTTGTYKGIAIYQDRRASDCNNCNLVNGNSGSIFTGALYFPSQELQYNGTGTTNATCTMFVAKRITFTGNSTTSNKFKKLADCSAEGLPSNATTRMVRLVG